MFTLCNLCTCITCLILERNKKLCAQSSRSNKCATMDRRRVDGKKSVRLELHHNHCLIHSFILISPHILSEGGIHLSLFPFLQSNIDLCDRRLCVSQEESFFGHTLSRKVRVDQGTGGTQKKRKCILRTWKKKKKREDFPFFSKLGRCTLSHSEFRFLVYWIEVHVVLQCEECTFHSEKFRSETGWTKFSSAPETCMSLIMSDWWSCDLQLSLREGKKQMAHQAANELGEGTEKWEDPRSLKRASHSLSAAICMTTETVSYKKRFSIWISIRMPESTWVACVHECLIEYWWKKMRIHREWHTYDT